MNYRRTAIAAGAGAAGVVTICAGLSVIFFIAIHNASFLAFGGGETTAAQWLLMLTIPPALVSVGGALPARALGAGWRQSVLIALAAHAVAILMLAGMLILEPFDDLGLYLAAIFIPAATLTVLLAAHYGDVSIGATGLVAVIATAAILLLMWLLLPHFAVAIALSILAWTLLPAISVLIQSPSGSETAPS